MKRKMASKLLSVALIPFILALFLRIFRINELTEFLGDQGRTGIVIYEAIADKIIPLVGPNVLSGHFLGPFFYYLIGPSFILSSFNPVAPAVFTAILGSLTALLIYIVSKKMFSSWIAFFITMLYAVSPSLVTQERIIWEPTPIPFFILLAIISCYKIYQKNYRYFALLGITAGILVQLHYPNLLFLFVALLFWLYLFLKRKAFLPFSKLFIWSGIGILAFSLTLLPFIIYETQHSFINLKGVLLSFFISGTSDPNHPSLPLITVDMSSRLFKNVIPLEQSYFFTFLQLSIIAIPFFTKRQFWHIFFSLWYIAGILTISLYKGVILNHYLNFLLPLPFFIFGFFVESITKIIPKKIVFVFLSALVLFQLLNTDIFSQGKDDVKRTQNAVAQIIFKAKNESFSFTLISSRSFSDLHYRYFFMTSGVSPEKITSSDYKYLFLVCEKLPCPSFKKQKQEMTVKALCYDHHCSGEYPSISLGSFRLTGEEKMPEGVIFTYQRK